MEQIDGHFQVRHWELSDHELADSLSAEIQLDKYTINKMCVAIARILEYVSPEKKEDA